MRIALVSACSKEYYPLACMSFANKYRYAQRQGYLFLTDTFNADTYYSATGKHPSWFKIVTILTRLELFDWIWWSDVDTIIANPHIQIEDSIDDRYDIIAGLFPLHHISKYTLHTGNFLIKGSDFSKNLFKHIYSDNTFTRFNDSSMREEDALIYAINTNREIASRILMADLAAFSSWIPMDGVEWNQDWQRYRPGDFIIHFPSPAPLSTRSEYMKKYISMTQEFWK